MKISQKIVKIANEPFVDDRIIQFAELLRVERNKRLRFEAIFKRGNFYKKQPDGSYFSVNSLSSLETNLEKK